VAFAVSFTSYLIGGLVRCWTVSTYKPAQMRYKTYEERDPRANRNSEFGYSGIVDKELICGELNVL
jgi:hypothetical protein